MADSLEVQTNPLRTCKKCKQELPTFVCFSAGRATCKTCLSKTGVLASRACYKYELTNEDFFESVDSPDKAYWLGFLTADGCITAGAKIILSLADRDRAHLAKFAKSIGTAAPIRDMTSTCRGKTFPLKTLYFRSKKMYGDLIKTGLTPRKSLTALPWQGPEHLMRHYWRGVVDGDGWVSMNGIKRLNFNVGLCGNYEIVEGFRAFILKLFPSLRAKVNVSGNIFNVYLGGRPSALAICKLLYDDADIYLDRKYEKYQKIMEFSKTRRCRKCREILLVESFHDSARKFCISCLRP